MMEDVGAGRFSWQATSIQYVIQIGAGGLEDQMLHGSGNGAIRTSEVGRVPDAFRAWFLIASGQYDRELPP